MAGTGEAANRRARDARTRRTASARRLTDRIVRTDQGKDEWQASRAMASSVGTKNG